MEAFLITAQFRGTGHVLRMGDNRLPKTIFRSELESGRRHTFSRRTAKALQGHPEGQPEALRH